MTREFFKNCRTLDELRSVYKNLLKRFHPDNGGTAEQCAKLNAEYAEMFEYLKNHSFTSDFRKEEKTNKNAFAYDDDITKMLYKIVILEGIEIEICGMWIWLGGNTYPHRETLRNLGFRWSKAKKLWHWTPYETGFYTGSKSMAQIRAMYGTQKVETEPYKAIS